MKKYLVLLLIILLVGCKKNTAKEIICERNSVDSYSYKEKVKVTLNGDKVESIKNVLKFDELDEATLYCESLDNYKIYTDSKLRFECENKIITIYNFDVLIEDDSIIGSTKEDLISLFTDNKYACK